MYTYMYMYMYMLWEKRHSFRASQLRSYMIIISTLPVFPLHKIRQSIGPIPRCGPAWASRFPSWECLESQFLPSPHPSRSRRRADHEHRWNGPIFSWWHWESTDGWLSSQKEWTSCVSRMLLRWYLLYISRSTLQSIIHLGLDIFGNIFTGNHRFLSIPSHPSRWSWPPCQPTDTYPRISFDHCRNPRFHYI